MNPTVDAATVAFLLMHTSLLGDSHQLVLSAVCTEMQSDTCHHCNVSHCLAGVVSIHQGFRQGVFLHRHALSHLVTPVASNLVKSSTSSIMM